MSDSYDKFILWKKSRLATGHLKTLKNFCLSNVPPLCYIYFINERKTMCEDYPACGHELNDCPTSMEDDYGWELDDFFEEEALTPEEEARERRSQEQMSREEMVGEMYASQWAFD